MKKIIHIMLISAIILIVKTGYVQSQPFQPININNNPVVSSCLLGNYGQLVVQVPTEVLSGDNIPLNITLPAIPANCTKIVTITKSSNLNFVSSIIPFCTISGTYTNCGVIEPNNGQNFNVMFKFPGGVTCNNASGEFTVKVSIDCGGVITSCEAKVKITARAANYWTISKEFIAGNLTCGESFWRIKLKHSNPNGLGLGAYNLSGNITESVSVPVIVPVGGIYAISHSYLQNGESWYNVRLQNCQTQGSTITNNANYNFTLGDNCGVFNGSVSATSPPLQSPNAIISFTKSSWANGGIYVNGCQGRYQIRIYNNGNTPWTNFTITDNLNIPGISINSISANTWTQTEAPPGNFTWTNPGLVLQPGESSNIYIFYTITGSTGSTVTNTANLSYSGGGGIINPGGPNPCPGINCPTINTSIQNTSVTNTFTIQQPQAIPSIVKCNVPNPNIVPIVQVGANIKFRIQVGNSGSAPLTTTITDALDATASQNLSIIPGSITTTYYSNQNGNYCGGISGTGVPFSTITGASFSPNTANLQNPAFNIVGLPGNCNLYNSNILVIEFEATVLPQIFGSKTNTSKMGTLTASANYTVDRTGELAINKVADVQFIENGGSFNYILTVTNVGSDPLNNVKVIDEMPPCVSINGPISVKKGTSNVTFTSSPNIVVTINPSATLQPGESFIVTIPVIKVSGTNCCNDNARAEARMLNGNQFLSAVTSVDQIACVQSNLCCDIPRFQVSWAPIISLSGNPFFLNVSSGSVPIQEIDISVVDYHVTYNHTDCKPANMGIFGNLSSSTANIGGLVLQNNNAHSLSWISGNPATLNHNIRLFLSKPTLLNIPCCNGRISFCLKVRIKDIDCNVCEKLICRRMNLRDFIIIPQDESQNKYPDGKSLKIRPGMEDIYNKMEMEQQLNPEMEEIEKHQTIDRIMKIPDINLRNDLLKQFLIKSKIPSVNNYGINDEGIK